MPASGAEARKRGFVEAVVGHPLFLLVAVAGVIVALSWVFIKDPGSLARMRDPSDPTWRAQALLAAHPSVVIDKTGPSGFISGAYRVITPLLGALLYRLADVGTIRFTALLQVGLPLLASLALAGFAYRHRGDPLAFVATLYVSAGLFLSRLFLGYVDDQLSLVFLAVAILFLDPARTSWGARTALGMLVFLSVMTHPPTALVFLVVVALGAGVGFVARRFSIRRTLAELGPALAAVSVGAGLAAVAWYGGAWGPRRAFGDSFMFQPYPTDFFRSRLGEWLDALRLPITWPLFVAGILWLGWRLIRGRVDPHIRITMLWSVPALGVLGFLFGLRYTYYRFLNATLGPMLVAGVGAWVIAAGFVWLGRRGGTMGLRGWPLRLLAVAGVVVVAFPVWRNIDAGIRYVGKQSEWTRNPTRVAMAAAASYAAAQPDRPIVFLMRPPALPLRGWGIANQWTRILLASVRGDEVARTYFFVGEVDDLLARRPSHTGPPALDELSRGFLEETSEGIDRWGSDPIVFYMRAFNRSKPPVGIGVPLGDAVWVLEGPGLAPFAPDAVPAARTAADQTDREMSAAPGVFQDPSHLVRVAAGLLLLLFVPGLLAARWFGVQGFAERLAFVPGLSLAMVLTAAFLVEAVTRAPFGPVQAGLSEGLAVAVGVATSTSGVRRRLLGWKLRSARPDVRVESPKDSPEAAGGTPDAESLPIP